MRCIGHLDTEEKARTFSDFLYVEGIANQVEDDPGHGWAVWISSEDEISTANDWLAKFRLNPTDARYRQKARQADRLKEQEHRSDADYGRKVRDRHVVFAPTTRAGGRPVCMLFIAIAVGVFLTSLGPAAPVVQAVFGFSQFRAGMPEILHGQLWRLVTPIFLHFGFLHILFNLFWLWDLGGMVESRLGSARLLGLLIGLAIVSNVFQYFAATTLLKFAAGDAVPRLAALVAQRFAELLGGPNFGGLSGVNYGLLGYIWMRGRHDPASGLFLHPQSVLIMLIWFVLCFTPVLGLATANGCHLAGLAAGTAWGYLAARPRG